MIGPSTTDEAALHFDLDDLLKVAKRKNNNKRSYLYVDPLQGKHIPVSPSTSLSLFKMLGNKLSERYAGEKLLVIGFAETATAVGAAIACSANNVAYFMTTTREDYNGSEYIYFSEVHSHAANQKLIVDGLENCIKNVDRIVFAEDEVTTGNTIMNLINALKRRFPAYELKFGIVSILNSMTSETRSRFEDFGIFCDRAADIPFQYKSEQVDDYSYAPDDSPYSLNDDYAVSIIHIDNCWNERKISSVNSIKDKISAFIKTASSLLPKNLEGKNVLVLGTEEFMFPGMLLGYELESAFNGISVRFHASTRSPIEVSDDVNYPVHKRFSISSFYEQDRQNYIYDLKNYDAVFIVTDADNIAKNGAASLVSALKNCGSENITIIQWSDQNHAQQLF